jgi:hypothetical protein
MGLYKKSKNENFLWNNLDPFRYGVYQKLENLDL